VAHLSIAHHEVIVISNAPMENVQIEIVIQILKKMMMVFISASSVDLKTCILDYTEIDYGNDEELELMKKVMGFCHFDTTKVYQLQ